ncbi:MAG: HAD family hydrolase [Brotaphodocola sp.]
MKYEAILFDLDGTLLPMDNDYFLKGYFHLLGQVGIDCGYKEGTFLAAMNRGVCAVVKNDGSCTNENRFWNTAAEFLGKGFYRHKDKFEYFYRNEFYRAKRFTEPTGLAEKAVNIARRKARKVILATSPLFPASGVYARMEWAGLRPEQFDWITDYSNSCTCKPNPWYYREITKKLELDPKKCLMIGNNVQEDVEAASAAGMDSFLVTDCLINKTGEKVDCPQGSFEAMMEYLEAL